MYRFKGELTRAMGYGLKCQEIQKRHLPAMHPDHASTLNDMGLVHETMGRYVKNKKIKKRGGREPTLAVVENNLAIMLR